MRLADAWLSRKCLGATSWPDLPCWGIMCSPFSLQTLWKENRRKLGKSVRQRTLHITNRPLSRVPSPSLYNCSYE